MAVGTPFTVAVGTTAVALNTTPDADGVFGNRVIFYNDGASTVYIGGPGTTATGAAKGTPVLAGGTFSDVCAPGDIYYGVCAAATSTNVIVVPAGV